MADVENQSLKSEKRPCSWAVTPEGILWGACLWIGLCSNLTLLTGIENNLVSKHVGATLCATSLLTTFLLYINHNKQLCFCEKYGVGTFGKSAYSLIAAFAIFSNFMTALLIAINTVDSGIATFVVIELIFLGLVYCVILFYKSNPERIDSMIGGCMRKSQPAADE